MVRFPTSRSVPPALPVLLLALVLAPHAFAADGFPVCDIDGDQDSPSLALATDLATWVAWRDGRRSDATVRTDVYVARLPTIVAAPGGPAGESAAPAPFAPAADGILACASGTAGPPIAVRTDSAGVLVLWGDSRATSGIYAQRLRSDGTLYPGWLADGRLISSDVEDLTLAACSDGSGGAYVARKPVPTIPGTQRIVVTRVTKTGAIAPGWTAAGVVIGGDDLVQGVTLTTDPGGGAVFTIRLYSFDTNDLQYARGGRVSPTGVVSFETLPGWRSNGSAPGIVGSLAISDDAGGFFAAWNDAPGPQFYGQHWNAAGTEQWPDSLPAPHMDALVADGTGGVYLVGREKQDLNRLSVLRRNSIGTVPADWDAAGRLLAQPLALAHAGAIPADGGVFAFWSELRNAGGTGFDIRASQVRPNGRLGVGWVGGGDAICDAPGDQTNVVGVAGSIVLAWVDARALATTKKDIWAKYVLGPEGGVGVIPAPVAGGPSIRIRSVFPNPVRDELGVVLASSAAGGPVHLELVDLRGRAVLRRTFLPDGEATTARFATRGLPAGLYWIRVSQAGATAVARVTVLR